MFLPDGWHSNFNVYESLSTQIHQVKYKKGSSLEIRFDNFLFLLIQRNDNHALEIDNFGNSVSLLLVVFFLSPPFPLITLHFYSFCFNKNKFFVVPSPSNCVTEKTKRNGQLSWGLGRSCVLLHRVDLLWRLLDSVWVSVAQIEWRIKGFEGVQLS